MILSSLYTALTSINFNLQQQLNCCDVDRHMCFLPSQAVMIFQSKGVLLINKTDHAFTNAWQRGHHSVRYFYTNFTLYVIAVLCLTLPWIRHKRKNYSFMIVIQLYLDLFTYVDWGNTLWKTNNCGNIKYEMRLTCENSMIHSLKMSKT